LRGFLLKNEPLAKLSEGRVPGVPDFKNARKSGTSGTRPSDFEGFCKRLKCKVLFSASHQFSEGRAPPIPIKFLGKTSSMSPKSRARGKNTRKPEVRNSWNSSFRKRNTSLTLFPRWFMPLQHVQFSLKWPILRSFHQTFLDWVFPNAEPLLMITVATAQLPIEEILLPNGFLRQMRPVPRRCAAPEVDPGLDRCSRNFHGRAK